MDKKKKEDDDNHRQVKNIQTLASKLPWIAVAGVIIGTLLILLQAYLFGVE